MFLPVAGLSINDGSSTTQALTTTAGKVTAWAGTGGNAANAPVESTLRPDAANSRILASRGVYTVDLDLTLVGNGVQDVVAQLYKNGVAIADLSGRVTVGNGTRAQVSFSGLLTITDSDVPGNIKSFSDPTGVGGSGGAPQNECPIEVYLKTVTSTVTVTVEAGHMTVTKNG